MQPKYALDKSCKNDRVKAKAVALGYVSMIMARCRRSASYQVRTLHYWLLPAIEHEQFMVLFDGEATPRGYLMWAYLAIDTERRLLNDPGFLMHPSEWNEGGRLWILDFCFPNGAVFEAIDAIKEDFNRRGVREVFWVRRNSDYTIKKFGYYNICRGI